MAGRPRTEFTREQLDKAKELLGRRVYVSKVAKDLQKSLRLTRDKSYELIAEARDEVFAGLTSDGRATDPLTAQYLFLESVVADPKVSIQHRINASLAIIKLLGLQKLMDKFGSADAEEVVAAILARRQAREQAAPRPDPAPPPVLTGTNGHPAGGG